MPGHPEWLYFLLVITAPPLLHGAAERGLRERLRWRFPRSVNRIMSNRTYICTKCRTARRAPAAGGLNTAFRCTSCGGPLWELSHKWRIPRKDDGKAWAELAEIVARSRPSRAAFIKRRGGQLLGKIDRRIDAVSARKPSTQRERFLKDLACEREQVLLRHFVDGVSLDPDSPPG